MFTPPSRGRPRRRWFPATKESALESMFPTVHEVDGHDWSLKFLYSVIRIQTYFRTGKAAPAANSLLAAVRAARAAQ